MVIIHKKTKETKEEEAQRKLKEEERALGIQDEYQAKGFELVSWIQDNKGIVTGIIAAIFLGGLAFSGYAYYKTRNQESATSAYFEALAPLEDLSGAEAGTDKLEEVQKKLVEISNKFPNAGAALLADIYAGHLALENKQFKDAVELYKAALGKVDAKNELYPLVLLGLGYALESDGQKKEALNRFEQIVKNKSGAAKELGLWKSARLARELGENERAKSLLTTLLEEFPSSSFESEAKLLKDSL